MATDTLQAESASEPPEEGNPAAPMSAAETIQSPEPARPASKADSLPPRLDAGENVEEVLGEVSKIFGQAGAGASPPAAPTEEDINEDLNDLIAAGTPVAKAPVPVEPSKEMTLGTAADLFRSSPAEVPDASVSRGEPQVAAPARRAEPLEARTSQLGGGAEPAANRTAVVTDRLRRLSDRLPPRARVPLAVAFALLMGWIAGASLTRSRAKETVPAVTTEKPPEEKVSEHSSELAAKAAALEEQLQQALAERAAAQRERDQALGRLQVFEVQARTGKQSTRAEIQQEQAARRKAEANFRGAEEQIHLLELRTYDVQLARVREEWRRNPGLALTLLNDADRCPARLRDFTWGYFHSRAQNDRATLLGHTGRVNAVAWSPDGKLIASCGQDGLVKFWDPGSGKEIASVVAHGGGAAALVFSVRGELLATAGADGTVKLWDVASRKIVATFFGHLGTVRAVAIAPDVSSLVSAGDDGTVRFWDVASRRATATRWGRPRSREPAADDPSQFVRSIAYSPDGLLVAAGGDQVVRIWETASASEKTMLSVAEGTVTALTFSPKGNTLAAGTDGAIYRWDVESLVPRSTPIAMEGRVNSLRYSADGRLLAAATDHGAFLFREPMDRAGDGPRRLIGHVGSVTGVALSPNGETVVTSGEDATLRLWNPQSGTIDKIDPDMVLRCRRPAVSVAYSPDGKRFAAGGSDAITLWNVSDGVETATLKNRSGDVAKIAFSPDGTRLASASKDWPILIWDLASQRVTAALNGHTAAVNSINFSADGKVLISGSDDATVRTWDVAGARELATLSGHAAAVLCTVVSPDGKLAASAGADHSVRLWDIVAKRPLATLAGHQAPVVAIAFSPDGHCLASAESLPAGDALTVDAKHRPIRLWQIPQGESAHDFGTPGSSVRGLSFSPDGKTLATCDRDGVTLWDAESCEPRETLRFADAGRLSPVVFSPNGLTLAVGGQSAIVFWTAADFAHGPQDTPVAESRSVR
jgi:WD40 repeat protein/outer membrane murein-binding lipoprotein Lpp